MEEEIDVQENRDQDNWRYQDEFQLEFPRLLPARKPPPDERAQERTKESDKRDIDGLIWEMIVGNQNPVDKLYDEPAARNECRQDFDDSLLP